MKEKTTLGGARFCANPHVLRAKPHSQHNANVKIWLSWKMYVLKIPYNKDIHIFSVDEFYLHLQVEFAKYNERKE